MLRFLPGAHRRCRVDVSTMDTDTPSRLVPSAPPSPPGPPARPGVPPKQVVSEVRRQHSTLNPRTRGLTYELDSRRQASQARDIGRHVINRSPSLVKSFGVVLLWCNC